MIPTVSVPLVAVLVLSAPPRSLPDSSLLCLRRGFNLRKIQKGSVVRLSFYPILDPRIFLLADLAPRRPFPHRAQTLKVWDLAGQPRFRSIWERYCRGVHAIVWVLDSADRDSFAVARAELHALLDKPELRAIPLPVSYTHLTLPTIYSV